MIWRGAKAPDPPRRDGWSSLYWASYVESEKSYQGQDMRKG